MYVVEKVDFDSYDDSKGEYVLWNRVEAFKKKKNAEKCKDDLVEKLAKEDYEYGKELYGWFLEIQKYMDGENENLPSHVLSVDGDKDKYIVTCFDSDGNRFTMTKEIVDLEVELYDWYNCEFGDYHKKEFKKFVRVSKM